MMIKADTRVVRNWKEQYPHHVAFPVYPEPHQYTYIGNPFRSAFVCGGAGSGKTESIINRFIKHGCNNNSPILLYDYKSPELALYLKQCSPDLPVYHIDFNNPSESAKVNPIAPKYITSPQVALEMAQTLFYNLSPKALSSNQDPFWNNSAISILQSGIWYMKEHAPESCNIPTLIDIILRPIGEVLKEFRKDTTCAKLLASVLTSLDQEATNLLASISSTVQSPLSLLIGDDIDLIMGADETPLDINNPEKPCIVIVGQNNETPQAYSPLVGLIISSALRLMNKPDKFESYVILDEAPTIYIPKIEDYPAVTRSRSICFVYSAQDISQIDKTYGKDRREALLSNLGNQFYGRTTNQETAKYIAQFFGKEDREYRSHGTGNNTTYGTEMTMGNNHSQNYSIQQRDVMQVVDILRFYPGQFAFIGADVPPGYPRLSVQHFLTSGMEHKQPTLATATIKALPSGKQVLRVTGQGLSILGKIVKGVLYLFSQLLGFMARMSR